MGREGTVCVEKAPFEGARPVVQAALERSLEFVVLSRPCSAPEQRKGGRRRACVTPKDCALCFFRSPLPLSPPRHSSSSFHTQTHTRSRSTREQSMGALGTKADGTQRGPTATPIAAL